MVAPGRCWKTIEDTDETLMSFPRTLILIHAGIRITDQSLHLRTIAGTYCAPDANPQYYRMSIHIKWLFKAGLDFLYDMVNIRLSCDILQNQVTVRVTMIQGVLS